MNQNTLIKLQNTELEILVNIDDFCKKHNIKYSLYGGTLIGAVRHQGFIPWDDDIDIVMTRSEYIRFCDVWKNYHIQGYYLEHYETDGFTQNTHAKIRKNGTMLLSDIEDENLGHHGIWIDIFIIDKVSCDQDKAKKVISAGRQLIFMAKANGRLPGESTKKKVARAVLKVLYPAAQRKKKLKQIADFLRNNDKTTTRNYMRCDMCTLDYLKIRFPQETGDEYTLLTFEGRGFQVFSNYDAVLRIMYGDYMKLPPIEERVCKHRPKKVLF